MKRKWLADLAVLVGGRPAAEPAQKADSGALPGLATLSGAARVQAAPGSPFAPSPTDLVRNPFGADSVFSIPTTPAVSPGPTTAVKVAADAPMDSAISAWAQAHSRMTANLGQLKNAIVAAFLGEAPMLVADLQKKVSKLDVLAKGIDTSLADALNKAKAASDAAGRKTAFQAVVGKFRNHLKAQDKFLTQTDANPVGVKTNHQFVEAGTAPQAGAPAVVAAMALVHREPAGAVVAAEALSQVGQHVAMIGCLGHALQHVQVVAQQCCAVTSPGRLAGRAGPEARPLARPLARATAPCQPVIEKILTQLGLQARAPLRAAARGQALQAA